MNINDKIRDEKLQYDINSATTKIFALSSSKIDKHEYITRKKYCLHDDIRQKKTSNSLIFWKDTQKIKEDYCRAGGNKLKLYNL